MRVCCGNGNRSAYDAEDEGSTPSTYSVPSVLLGIFMCAQHGRDFGDESLLVSWP